MSEHKHLFLRPSVRLHTILAVYSVHYTLICLLYLPLVYKSVYFTVIIHAVMDMNHIFQKEKAKS